MQLLTSNIRWHGDIKPANILRVNGEFKLADFGFTGFARDQETLEETMIGGTSTYCKLYSRDSTGLGLVQALTVTGAPECDSYARGERSGTNSQKMNAQKMDTWSFGCLLSAVATWVILGSQAYDNYTQRRKIAIQKLRHRKAAGEDVSVPSADDAFHDGVRVLPAVTNWHKYLQNSIRKGDTISGLVLEYVDQNLLVADPRERPSFANLTARLRHILAAAKAEYSSMKEKELIPTVDDDTLDALLELDRNAPQQATATYQLAPAQTATIAEETAPVSGSQQLTVPGPRKPGMVSTRVGKSERLSKILRGKIASRDETISETLGKPSAMNADNYQQESGYQRRPEMPTEKPSSEHGNKVKGGDRSVAVQVSARDATAQEALHISYGALAPSPQIIVAEPSAGATPRYLEHNQEAVIGNNAVGAHPNPTNTETARRPATIPSISIHPPAIHSPGLDQQPFGSEASKEYGQRPASPMLDGTITSSPPQSPPTDSAGRISVDWPPPIFGEFTAQEEQWMHPTPLDKIRKKYPVSADLKAFINDRDIIFVVDNGPSMARSWRLAKLVVTTLSRKIGPLDDDGLELVFTCGGTAFNKKKIQGWDIRDQFPKQMDKADPAKIQAQGSHPGRETDMNEILRQIFDEYKPKRAKKRLTLIILTDGVWRSSAPDDVENLIASYQRSIEELGKWEKRWFSIGFVAFGSDQNALRRLKDLDETMKTKFKIK